MIEVTWTEAALCALAWLLCVSSAYAAGWLTGFNDKRKLKFVKRHDKA